MPNNKKQRGREERKKKIEAQREAKRALEEQQAQQDAEELRARLRGLFGTPAIDAVITDLGRSVSAAEKQMENSTCYHGCPVEHFVAGSPYVKLVQSYVSLNKKYDEIEERYYDADQKFYNEKGNQQIYSEDEFANFVFAVAVALYFKLSSEERERYYTVTTVEQQKPTAMYELKIIIGMGLNIKYILVPGLNTTQSQQERFHIHQKVVKYSRDIDTERGLIQCLHRETKQYCGCMATKNNEAKGMSKMERCEGCRNEFPKTLMKKCDGCEWVVYCGEQCQSQDWPYHQIACQKEQGRRAAKTMHNTVVIDSEHPFEVEGGTNRDGSDDGNSRQGEEPATTKGIVHGSCDGCGNIGSYGHENEDKPMTTKIMKAKVPPPPSHKNHTAPNQNDKKDGTSTRKEASIVTEGRSTEIPAAAAAATVPCKTQHPPSELHTENNNKQH